MDAQVKGAELVKKLGAVVAFAIDGTVGSSFASRRRRAQIDTRVAAQQSLHCPLTRSSLCLSGFARWHCPSSLLGGCRTPPISPH
jgi:hypothetical protein